MSDFGDPMHHGGPSRAVIAAIFRHTTKDSRDRLYYRTVAHPEWRRLRRWCYDLLNREIDRARTA